MIVTPSIAAMTVAHWGPPVAKLRRPGKLRALRSGASETELRNAVAAGAGTLELYGTDITLSSTAALAMPSGLAVIDMTGTSIVRAGAASTATIVTMAGANNAVWACDMDGGGNMTTTGRFLWMDARDNVCANTHFSGGSSQTLGVRISAGGRKASVLGCTSSGLWTTVTCATSDVEDGTWLVIDACDVTAGTRRYIFTVAVNGSLKMWVTRSIFREHASSPNFQHIAQQASTGRYAAPYEAGCVYQGNGLPFERTKEQNNIAPNGCADQASIHGADDAKRVGQVYLDGGEACNVFTRGTDGFVSEHSLAINLDTAIAIGAKYDDPLEPGAPDPAFITRNGIIRNHVALGSGLDRAEDHGGLTPDFPNGGEAALVLQDAETVAIENFIAIGPFTTSQKIDALTSMSGMKRAIQGNRATGITMSGVRSFGQLLDEDAVITAS
jgi:hypothetical protein